MMTAIIIRDEILFNTLTSPTETQRIIKPYEGNVHFLLYQNAKALAKSLKNNQQRRFCKQLLWRFIDDLEFDYLDRNFQSKHCI